MKKKKKKQKSMSIGDFKKLIRQIARATKDREHGEMFGSLLSAMRGPDSFEPFGLKQETTTIIRSRLGWCCGMMDDDGRDIEEVGKCVVDSYGFLASLVANDTHFSRHIRSAVTALKHFGFDKPRKK